MANATPRNLIATEAEYGQNVTALDDIFSIQMHHLAVDAVYGPRGTPMRLCYTGTVRLEMVADFWEFSTGGQL